MSLQVSVAISVRSGSGYSVHALGKAIRRTGVGSEEKRGCSIDHNERDVDVLRAHVIVDDPDAFMAALEQEIRSDGLEVLGAKLGTVRLLEPQELSARGAAYEVASGTL